MAEEKKDKETERTKRPTAQKRDMQNEKRRIANRSFRSRVLTAVRALETAISQSDKAAVKENLSAVYSLFDKGVKTGIYKLNKASRMKSRLQRRTAKI